MFNSITGHFDLQVPNLEGFDFPGLKEKAAELRRLEGEYREAGRKVRELEDSRRQAKRDDTALYAEAIKAGKKDPGTKASDALQAQIEAVTRRRDALRVVLKDRGHELLALVENGREGWTVEALASLTSAEEALEEARAAVEHQEAEVLRHRQVVAFLENPAEYRPNRVGKKPNKPAAEPPPTFSVIGGRPPGGAGVA